MNASEVIAKIRTNNPTLRWAKNRDETVIGFWSDQVRAWVPYFAKSIMGGWVMGNMPLVNGQCVVAPSDWVE